MKTASKKAKGRIACKEAKDVMLRYCPCIRDGDLIVTPSGVTGPDIMISPKALEYYPLAIEVKFQESCSPWSYYEQAQKHLRTYKDKAKRVPVVAFRRSRSEMMALLSWEHFIALIRGDLFNEGKGVHKYPQKQED